MLLYLLHLHGPLFRTYGACKMHETGLGVLLHSLGGEVFLFFYFFFSFFLLFLLSFPSAFLRPNGASLTGRESVRDAEPPHSSASRVALRTTIATEYNSLEKRTVIRLQESHESVSRWSSEAVKQ